MDFKNDCPACGSDNVGADVEPVNEFEWPEIDIGFTCLDCRNEWGARYRVEDCPQTRRKAWPH